MINNHYSAKLSDIDVQMVKTIVPGGNWKNIPLSIPSKRLEQIRSSYAAGQGSRSTYYGRLDPSRSAYTVNTYFNRPGNGCFIHYDLHQHRLISQREAARLQSFPDDFVFHGPKTSVFKQIGNAVPPLLAYNIAKQLGKPGVFADLFSGAGGLSLGFKWAGWIPLAANDIDKNFLETYKHNVHGDVVIGDIANKDVASRFIELVKEKRKQYSDKPFLVLGGPPCQGFSTAGARSSKDTRNFLFKNYHHLVSELRPDGFVFENVMGMLTMDGGKFFDQIQKTLKTVAEDITVWKVNSADFGVPQKRKRVIIIGHSKKKSLSMPTPITPTEESQTSVFEALSDLPKIDAGQDGSDLDYCSKPKTNFQKLMRGQMLPEEFLKISR